MEMGGVIPSRTIELLLEKLHRSGELPSPSLKEFEALLSQAAQNIMTGKDVGIDFSKMESRLIAVEDDTFRAYVNRTMAEKIEAGDLKKRAAFTQADEVVVAVHMTPEIQRKVLQHGVKDAAFRKLPRLTLIHSGYASLLAEYAKKFPVLDWSDGGGTDTKHSATTVHLVGGAADACMVQSMASMAVATLKDHPTMRFVIHPEMTYTVVPESGSSAAPLSLPDFFNGSKESIYLTAKADEIGIQRRTANAITAEARNITKAEAIHEYYEKLYYEMANEFGGVGFEIKELAPTLPKNPENFGFEFKFTGRDINKTITVEFAKP